MKKYRQKFKEIAGPFLVIATWIILLRSNSNLAFYLIMIAAVIGYLAYSLYTKIKYRQGKENYLLVPHANDKYTKIASIIVGVLIFVGCVTSIMMSKAMGYSEAVWFIAGLLLFLGGIFALPTGYIKIKNGTISISGLKKDTALLSIMAIHIFQTTIQIELQGGSKLQAYNFNFDNASAERLRNYLQENATAFPNIYITNNLPQQTLNPNLSLK